MGELMKKINKFIINPIIVLVFGIALVMFIIGILQYVLNPASDEERDVGRRHILWGLFGMFIMVSVWGIMNIIINTLGVSYINSNNIRGGEIHVPAPVVNQ